MKGMGRLLGSALKAPIKGKIGETLVQAGAAVMLPSSVYRQFHDVTLPTEGGTAQLDHVFVSVFGVFVVETKNMSGWIFGSEQDRNWTQVFPGGRKVRFPNPLRQNHGHVRALEDVMAGIGLPRGTVKSVVVFVGDAEFKRKMPENVTVGAGGAQHIRSFKAHVLSETQVAEVCEAIESKRMERSWETNRRHVRNVRREDPQAARHCPRCGRKMVLRTARKGQSAGKQFWGCEGFPACRMVEQAQS
ncbi:MAG: nuclease [Caldilineaceae bacterium SB0670_bin_27]|uniref:Nuclease n=1 Tax=Caldilineaceae bacterium SB0664_bin_27 TaxID=2605260 RepID=A0A6B0YQT7_9CHLR|nr:nuclease [Caldilineaceae bacterium SB0664_bin_27]MYJ79493.1 nuclease [Caldilineaceae bacterium SB0670_bin_27]